MLKNLIILAIAMFSFLYFTGCVGQPRVSPKKQHDDSGRLWAEQTNIDQDEDDNVDISDLDKNVTSDSEISNGIIQRMAFPEAEYSSLERTGKGTINGYIFVEDVYGTKVYGKNTKLYLNPITSYSKQWYIDSYLGGKKMSKADNRLFNYIKFTASGDDGRFSFYGVPSGGYYLTGTVVCGTECGYETPKSIRITTEVFVNGSQIVNHDIHKKLQ